MHVVYRPFHRIISYGKRGTPLFILYFYAKKRKNANEYTVLLYRSPVQKAIYESAAFELFVKSLLRILLLII